MSLQTYPFRLDSPRKLTRVLLHVVVEGLVLSLFDGETESDRPVGGAVGFDHIVESGRGCDDRHAHWSFLSMWVVIITHVDRARQK